MGTKLGRTLIVLFCLSGLAGVGCSSDDHHHHHDRDHDRWDDRDYDHGYRPGPHGPRDRD